MEAIPLKPGIVVVPRNRKPAGCRRARLMEGCVETGNLSGLWQPGRNDVNGPKVVRHVQWCQWHKLLKRLPHGRCDHYRSGKHFSPVNDTMAHGGDGARLCRDRTLSHEAADRIKDLAKGLFNSARTGSGTDGFLPAIVTGGQGQPPLLSPIHKFTL
jgi:hypothetical protein